MGAARAPAVGNRAGAIHGIGETKGMGIAANALLALGGLVGSTLPTGSGALAPDGEHGLGSTTPLADLLERFRKPDASDQLLFRALRDLRTDLELAEAQTLRLYEQRGIDRLAGPHGARNLEEVHQAFLDQSLEPAASLNQPLPQAVAFADAFLDPRFRTRLWLLEDWRADLEEVTAGVAVIQAASDGYVQLGESEARSVALRVDLAAALLRARVKDLDALREKLNDPLDVDPQARLELFNAAAAEGASTGLADIAQREGQRAARMRELLFSADLRSEVSSWIAWRASRRISAERALQETLRLQPGGDEERRKTSKTDQRREALEEARRGLGQDPLDPELAYQVAELCLFVGGRLEAASGYDRFLALRGIRAHEADSYDVRELDEEELRALSFLTEFAVELGGGFPLGAGS